MVEEVKKFDLNSPDGLATLRNILLNDYEENLEEEHCGDASDSDEEDFIQEREGDSDTEQDADSGDEAENGGDMYLGKDGMTLWSKTKPSACDRKRDAMHFPEVLGDAQYAVTPYECWRCIISEDMIEKIVEYTNMYIFSIKDQFERERDAKPTDVVEFKAFIGLLYLAGILKSNRQLLEEMWSEDGFGVERFRLVMSLKRFKFLIRCTRFDDPNTRKIRKLEDKLAAVRELLTMFVANCQKSYSLGQDVTVDEKTEGFRGRCAFKQYIPSKPYKIGLKFYALVDAKIYYTYNLELYAGEQPKGAFDVSDRPEHVVARLAEPLFGTRRNITCDKWFTSFESMQYLKEKKLSLLGIIHKNKSQLPPEFVNTKSRAAKSNKFCFNKTCSLVSHVPRKGKNVLLLSSFHHDDQVDEETGKAKALLDYNATKSGIDILDKLCSTYNVTRNTHRWTMIVFFTLLNIAGINSEIIAITNSNFNLNTKNRRRNYLKALSNELCLPQLQRRSVQKTGLPTELQLRLRNFQPAPQPDDQTPDCHEGKRKRCLKCRETKRTRFSKYNCKKCVSIFFCLEHACMICENCYKTAFEHNNYSDD